MNRSFPFVVVAALTLGACEEQQQRTAEEGEPETERREGFEVRRTGFGEDREAQLERGFLEEEKAPALAHGEDVRSAVAVLHAAKDGKVAGVVHFHKRADGIHVQADVEGLQQGTYPIEVASDGDCTAENVSMLGEQLDLRPAPKTPEESKSSIGVEPKEGDRLTELVVPATGKATYDHTESGLQLTGRESIIGRAVVMAAPSDPVSKETKLYCGVIGIDAR
jgi:Cu/Zn superoxide dismutase